MDPSELLPGGAPIGFLWMYRLIYLVRMFVFQKNFMNILRGIMLKRQGKVYGLLDDRIAPLDRSKSSGRQAFLAPIPSPTSLLQKG